MSAYVNLHHSDNGWYYLYVCNELVLVAADPDTILDGIWAMTNELDDAYMQFPKGAQ